MKREKELIQDLARRAGLTINGSNAWDPQIHDARFYDRVWRDGSLGLGESYEASWWDCERLDQFFHKIFTAKLDREIKGNWNLLLRAARNIILNPGRRSKAFEIGQRHYDIGNDLYRVMLDRRMVYTCGYWPRSTSSGQENARDLNEAQEAKLDIVCRKIGLKPGQRVLDIGSGWGSFIGYAAEKYGVNATGLTVSKEQKELADELNANLPAVTRLQDYRDLDNNERFDRIVSLGMFEHVGYKNYRAFMEVVYRSLEDNGLFLLHTIGGNHSVRNTDPWIAKYIFPNSMIPSVKQISQAIEGLFVLEDWHNFGNDYDKTLMAWYQNFEDNWNKIKHNYGERFYRMWKYYLLSSAGSFRARKNQLWQIVLSKHGVPGGYQSVR